MAKSGVSMERFFEKTFRNLRSDELVLWAQSLQNAWGTSYHFRGVSNDPSNGKNDFQNF